LPPFLLIKENMTAPYYNYFCGNIEDLKHVHPGMGIPTSATIFGPDYPTNEAVSFYVWDWFSTNTPDDDECVKPYAPPYDPMENGRWIKADLSETNVTPQVNSDWNANSGVSAILNKPSLASVATSGQYSDLSGTPTIPTAQVNTDWNSSSGKSQLLNKPSFATVAFSGSYNDLSSKPSIPGSLTVGSPATKTVALATSYQAADTTKAAIITVTLNSTASLSLTAGATIAGEIRIGNANTVATGASGTAVGNYRNSLTGTLVVGLAVNTESQQTITFVLPAGWYFAVRQTTGTGLSVVSAFEQSLS